MSLQSSELTQQPSAAHMRTKGHLWGPSSQHLPPLLGLPFAFPPTSDASGSGLMIGWLLPETQERANWHAGEVGRGLSALVRAACALLWDCWAVSTKSLPLSRGMAAG